jgi:NAD(P)-dependent dehydrogenase (short-subunit alcohol dehydrogenase family)
MSTASPVLLVLGAGSNVGQHVARAFAAKGYKIALVSRRQKEEDNTADQVHISSDLSDPDSVIGVFSKVKALLGFPSVVIYNGKNDAPKPKGSTRILLTLPYS